MASQVCAISQCQHLSVRLIQLRLRQLQRERVTGVSLILPIGFVPFVFSAQVTALPATRTEEDKLSVPQPTLLEPFEVMSKYIAHSAVIGYVSGVFFAPINLTCRHGPYFCFFFKVYGVQVFDDSSHLPPCTHLYGGNDSSFSPKITIH